MHDATAAVTAIAAELGDVGVGVAPFATRASGGTGQHLAQVAAALEAAGRIVHVAPGAAEALPPVAVRRSLTGSDPYEQLEAYDTWVAERWLAQQPPLGAVVGVPGASRRLFEATPHARRILVATNLHAQTNRRWAMAAIRRTPLEASWLTRRLVRRMRAEYELADLILTNSPLCHQVFLDAGVAASKLRLAPIASLERPPQVEPDPPVDVLYVGGLTVEKGVVDLLHAFRAAASPHTTLRLMGGPRSPGMRRYLAHAAGRDRRITWGPGRAWQQLPTTRLVVVPSHADSFSFAVAEAVVSGVPVVTTDHVGAAHLVTHGDAAPGSAIVSAGDRKALAEAMRPHLR